MGFLLPDFRFKSEKKPEKEELDYNYRKAKKTLYDETKNIGTRN